MSKKTGILDEAEDRHNPPWALTGEEVVELMRNFTAGKVCILEADATLVCRWAEAHKRSAYLLAWVLDGALRLDVQDGVVTLAPPVPGGTPLPGSPN
jgi:hypothetical protein